MLDTYTNEELQAAKYWVLDGKQVHISKLNLTQLKDARQKCITIVETTSFVPATNFWLEWAGILGDEIRERTSTPVVLETIEPENLGPAPTPKGRSPRWHMKCHCGTHYETSQYEFNRQGGRACSKECRQERHAHNKKVRLHLTFTKALALRNTNRYTIDS